MSDLSLMSFLIRTLILSDQSPALMNTFNLIITLDFPSTNIATLGVKSPTSEFVGGGGHTYSFHNRWDKIAKYGIEHENQS